MKGKRFLIKLILGFLLFLIVPLSILGAVFYYYMINYSENEIVSSNSARLKVIRNIDDLFLEEIRQSALRLSLNSAFENLNSIDSYNLSYSSGENMIKMSKVIDIISEISRTSNKIHSVYLYPDNSDFVITTNNGVISKTNFTDASWLKNYLQYKQGEANVLWTGVRNIVSNNSGDESIISYIYPLVGYTSNLRGALVVNIKESEFSRLINNNNFEQEGRVTVLDAKGVVLSSVDKNELGKTGADISYINSIMQSDNTQGSINTEIKGKKYLITYYKSDFNNWIYLDISSMDKLFRGILNIKILIIYTLGILIIIGFLLSLLISKNFYNPVDRLVKSEDEMKRYIEKNKKSVKEQGVMNLVYGNIKDYDNLLINFNYGWYQCICLSVDHYTEFEKNHSIEDCYSIKSLISKSCEDILNTKCSSYCISLDKDKFVTIINYDDTICTDGNSSEIMDLLPLLQERLKASVNITVTIGIGCCYKNIEDIHNSFKEASNALKLKLIKGCAQIIQWKEEYNNIKEYFYPYDEEKYILNILNLGKKEDIEEAVKNFFEAIKRRAEDHVCIDNILQINHQLIANTMKYLFDSGIAIADITGQVTNIYEDLNKKETIDDVEQWFQRLYISIINYCNNRKRDNKIYINKILKYIENNYKKNIGIETISDYVGLSYSYIRKIFKEETGKNIIDYINMKRIEESKRLLTETDYSILDIAISLGYNNDQSFNRFFKKYEGIIPSEFRKKIKYEPYPIC